MGACASGGGGEKAGSSDSSVKDQNLTEAEITLIRAAWKLVAKKGLAFYGTQMMIMVFLEHRHLKPLWRFAQGLETRDQMEANAMLKAHGEKLFNALDLAIGALDDLATLVPILIQLGYSHYTFGVREEHFPYIGESLIGTLTDGLKEDFTPKTKKAYLKMFGYVKNEMLIGMRQAESEKATLQTNK